MTTCDRMRQRLLLAGSGELPALERTAVDRHLAACLECRRFHAQAAWILDRVPAALEATPPVLDPASLEARARTGLAPLIPFRLPRALAAAAALALAILGAALWLGPLRPDRALEKSPRLALLDEWQFWLVSSLEREDGETDALQFASVWNEQDLARHLLALEGLLPEETGFLEEFGVESILEALPPITLRDCNTPAPLRS